MKNTILIFLLTPLLGFAGFSEHPFDYDLHLHSLPGTNQRTMICFHGYGDNYQIAETLKDLYQPEATLVSFNFPEHDIKQDKKYDPKTASFGTIDELLPALYVMKKIILDQGLESVDLYGFSAGGGALVNSIVALNTTSYNAELKRIGIGVEEKKRLLSAIEKGIIMLDAPLKSIEEIMDFRGSTEELEILANHYRKNGFRPIDSVNSLKGLSLDIVLYFEEKDEILSNRDDAFYIKRLEKANSQGTTSVVIENEGSHSQLHRSPWKLYSQKLEMLKEEGLDG